MITQSYLQSGEQYVQKTDGSLTQAWIQPQSSSFALLLWFSCTHTSTLCPHSIAPADGTTHTTEAKGNYTTALLPWTQELQPV